MSTAARIPEAALFLVIEDREWIDFAVCCDQGHLFFEPWGERPSARLRRESQAKRLCASCPVQAPCLDAGRRNHESGVWGGETEEERALAGYAPRGNARRAVAAARRTAAGETNHSDSPSVETTEAEARPGEPRDATGADSLPRERPDDSAAA